MSLFGVPDRYPLRVLARDAELIAAGEVERVAGGEAHVRVSRAWKGAPDDAIVRVVTHEGVV